MSGAPTGLSADERAASAVCADWLATARVWEALAVLGVIAGLAGLATGGVPHALLVLVPAALAERVLAVRLAFDTRLFARLADGSLTLEALDAGLRQVLDVPASKAGRPLAPRIAGARRLYRLHAASVVLIVLAALASWMT